MNENSNAIAGCEAVNAHINKPIPSTLWHYTSYAGFQGIVSSKTIWATEYRFLNDRQELLHAKDLAQALLEEEPEFIGERFPNREMIRQAVNTAFNTGHLHEGRLSIMVASFSEEGDQLSQWRGYAEDSRGVSVGLDLRNLRPPAHLGTAVTFAACIYTEAEKRALLKSVFAYYRNGVQAWWESIHDTARKQLEGSIPGPQFVKDLLSEHTQQLNEVIFRGNANLRFDLLRVSPLLKNESFSEEREWRLVLPWEPIQLPTQHPIQLRSTRDTLVPYIAYPLNSPNQEGPIFCKDVILGAGSHSSAEIGVNLFLRKQGIPVLSRPSKIPYRPT